MTKTIRSLGENGLIAAIATGFQGAHPRLIKGIGDDTSVTTQRSGRALLATTDILIEGVHFKKSYATPYLLGRKSLSISLSDIAAMGGAPLFHIVSIALPPETPKAFVNALYRGINACAVEFGSCLAGGNTARLPGRVMVSTTALGEMPEDLVVYRSGAQPGDVVFVTGTLGDAALGLRVLQTGGAAALRGRFKAAARKHLDPSPRMEAGRMLAFGRLATAMMDISDGLGIDLKRLCESSDVAAEININRLPLSGELLRYTENKNITPEVFAMTGGEDYELLFTADPKSGPRIAAASKRLGLRMTAIGTILTKKRGLAVAFLDERGRRLKIARLGFEHF